MGLPGVFSSPPTPPFPLYCLGEVRVALLADLTRLMIWSLVASEPPPPPPPPSRLPPDTPPYCFSEAEVLVERLRVRRSAMSWPWSYPT